MEKEIFLEVIDRTPLVSIDIVLENAERGVLLGKRLNKPAEGYWFVPGGRIRKNETLNSAMKRISLTELGIEINIKDAEMIGAFDHIYEDNFSGSPQINTHYVALGYRVKMNSDMQVRPDSQHSEMQWLSIEELLKDESVHANTKAYFR